MALECIRLQKTQTYTIFGRKRRERAFSCVWRKGKVQVRRKNAERGCGTPWIQGPGLYKKAMWGGRPSRPHGTMGADWRDGLERGLGLGKGEGKAVLSC